MQPINTRFTKLLNIKSPIVSAPMAGVAGPDMAASTTASGGFGFLGAALFTTEQLKTSIQAVRTKLDLPQGVPVPVGVGFLGWCLDKTEVSEDPRIPSVLEELPVAVWFAFGDDLGKYIAQVRSYEANREHKTLIFVIVNSVADALRAVNEWKVDVLVAQGIEAGGHGGSEAPPLFTLLPAILAAIPDGPPVIAAGGIATGAQVASLLTLGAGGVVLGTRLLFTHECTYPESKKSVLLAAHFNSTTRSMAFDEVNRTMGWPDKCDGRAIANDIMTDCQEGLDLEERLKRFDESKEKDEKNRLVVWAGIGAGHTNEIKSTSEVVHELHDEAVRTLKSVPALLG